LDELAELLLEAADGRGGLDMPLVEVSLDLRKNKMSGGKSSR
jgi:hypothetical protein